MVRKVRREANLVLGASLRGLVFDACFDNRIPHTFGMLRHFGMPNRNRVLVSESPDLDVVGLATALRIPETEVTARRYPAIGRGHRDFYGIQVMKGRIEDRVRRFSPAAIASGVLHHPATHELRDLPFSTVGWDMLQDTCPCEPAGVRQNWVTTNGTSRCHSCGGSLGKIEAVPVPDGLKPSLTLISRLVDPDPCAQRAGHDMLPHAIRGASRTLIYDLIMNLAKVIGVEADVANSTARTDLLARACEALIRWPAGFSSIERSADCPTNVWDWVRRTYAILDGAGQPAASEARSGTPAFAPKATQPGYVPSGSKGRISTQFISAMAAARLGGIDEQALKQAWDDGRFTQHLWVLGSSRVRAFDPAEVVALTPRMRVLGSRLAAARFLGLPLYGAEQLIEAELLTPAAPGGGIKQMEAHLSAANALSQTIEAAGGDVNDGMPFLEAIRHVSGRPKPFASALGMLLAGEMRFGLTDSTTRTGVIGRIRVHRDAVSDLTALPHDPVPKARIVRADRWSGVDALHCLNGNRSASELLMGLESQGSTTKRQYLVTDILERAAIGVTTSDLSRRSGCSIAHVAGRLKAHNVPQIAPGLWQRRQAEELTFEEAVRGVASASDPLED